MAGNSSVIEIQLRWGDMDPLNHINNVQFARIFEEARVRSMNQWFDERREFSFFIARQEIEFVAPLLYSEAPATVEVWISRIGEKSFDYGYRLRASTGELSALAETTCTTVDLATGRPTPMPASLTAELRRHAGDEVELRRRR
ncbi:thioesterase family protein [Gordonia sp. (in: high G+C Gram-positive bacteria)]|uniref:acyl-CoA thioesterase n=1 Tax=Gordonia sp. (in: high G+C Gram-positive bacteria) TaxID=84139 RepID=UPI0016955A30|nr:thioesterase family protein [Gordonia sp. (in: high G+C Gram-positive bacteria)]NLG46342.1 acyl-CoA thioesterase [Gordonia sp. (in: high G+C Gram-positive bacteria)]